MTNLVHKFLFYNMFRTQQVSEHVEEYNKLIIKQKFVH